MQQAHLYHSNMDGQAPSKEQLLHHQLEKLLSIISSNRHKAGLAPYRPGPCPADAFPGPAWSGPRPWAGCVWAGGPGPGQLSGPNYPKMLPQSTFSGAQGVVFSRCYFSSGFPLKRKEGFSVQGCRYCDVMCDMLALKIFPCFFLCIIRSHV